jgi:hypothetical protein
MGSIKEGVKVDHVPRHGMGPFEDLGQMQTKNASEDQRPRIMIFAGEWPRRKTDAAAAPDQME